MAGPVFATGNLTREVGKKVEKYRLVKEVNGKIEHCDAATFPLGAVSEPGAPRTPAADNDLTWPLPDKIRVHTAQCVVLLETADASLAAGAKVYTAADGKVSATDTGAKPVGIVDRASTAAGPVRIHLFHPAAFN